jgi:ubiquinone/menaquinone biosynthesis C-methylase UbiE
MQNKKPFIPKKKPNTKKTPAKTSWGVVADWYDEHLETSKDSYQEKVIAPNLLRILSLTKNMRVLDLACGQGFFTRKWSETGAQVTGADISPELIAQAKKHSPKITFHATPAHKLSFAKDGSFDVITIVLAIQNIENMEAVFTEAKRVLAPKGKMILVLNHPTFRIPKRSSWGWDEQAKMQFRRIDGYLSSKKIGIDMHPGKTGGEQTITYHRPLQEFVKTLSKTGFAVSKLEEWISHKKSQSGPRQSAEDTARKEIPLFMMIEVQKLV